MLKVTFSRTAVAGMRKIPRAYQARIIEAVNFLKEDPFYGKKMWGVLKGKRNIRVWPYRILYEFNAKKSVIEIVRIGHRGGIGYK